MADAVGAAWSRGGSSPASAGGLVTIEVPEGCHIESHDPREPLLIPTVLGVEAPKGIAAGEVAYPEGVERTFDWSPAVLRVYRGTFELSAPVKVEPRASPGSVAVLARLSYQGCTESLCLMPSEQAAEARSWRLPRSRREEVGDRGDGCSRTDPAGKGAGALMAGSWLMGLAAVGFIGYALIFFIRNFTERLPRARHRAEQVSERQGPEYPGLQTSLFTTSATCTSPSPGSSPRRVSLVCPRLAFGVRRSTLWAWVGAVAAPVLRTGRGPSRPLPLEASTRSATSADLPGDGDLRRRGAPLPCGNPGPAFYRAERRRGEQAEDLASLVLG